MISGSTACSAHSEINFPNSCLFLTVKIRNPCSNNIHCTININMIKVIMLKIPESKPALEQQGTQKEEKKTKDQNIYKIKIKKHKKIIDLEVLFT